MNEPVPPLPGVGNRPRGYAPRGTSLGFAGLNLMAVGVPYVDLACAAPVIRDGVDLWLASIPYVLAFALLPILVLIAGLRSRRYWVICLFFYFGAFLLVAYALSLPAAVVILLGAFPVQEQGVGPMSVIGMIFMLALALPAWWLLRALRLRYWQPGSAPETWEPGDETPPAWALSPSRYDRP